MLRAVLVISSLIAYTHSTFIGHKKLFHQFVPNYGQPKALVDNQKLQPGFPWDNHYFLLFRTLAAATMWGLQTSIAMSYCTSLMFWCKITIVMQDIQHREKEIICPAQKWNHNSTVRVMDGKMAGRVVSPFNFLDWHAHTPCWLHIWWCHWPGT